MPEWFFDPPILKYKKLTADAPDLDTPKNGDAGYDLKSNQYISLWPYVWTTVSTGIAIEIPEGYVGLIRGRSGRAFKDNIISFDGTIDSNYRGEIKLRVRYEPDLEVKRNGDLCFSSGVFSNPSVIDIKPRDRLAQIIIVPCYSVAVQEVQELSITERGSNGFGSSGT